ncbi:MAG: hypothetical protein AAFR61_11425 [Bacteroidota bacterium]
MKPLFLISLLLHLTSLPIFSQVSATSVSSMDSVVRVVNYADTSHLESAFWNDSSQIIVHGLQKTYKSLPYQDVLTEDNPLVALTTPQIIDIYQLTDSIYALIGWSAWYKCQLKYLWILRLRPSDFEIDRKIFFSTPRASIDRSFEINFSWDAAASELILNNNANGIWEEGFGPGGFFPGLKVFDQNHVAIEHIKKERLKNYRLVRHQPSYYFQENEINYRIRIE